MTRRVRTPPLFGPSRGLRDGGDGSAVATPPAGSLTVTRLNELIRDAVAANLPQTLTVVGELSNVARPASGHLYFTLKDAGSEIRCAMWRSMAGGLRFAPADGLSVVATGGVEMYVARGQVQFYVRRLDPLGVGALELAFRQLREKLAGEGLFDPARKRPLPAFPRTIAIVTSLTGAAIRDMLQTIERRFPCVRVLVHAVRVQGEGAANEVATAIRAINRSGDALGGVDVMIVGRGGGSLEDLWAFNEEVVARAIVASRIPVVSAVGHETDVCIADLAADVRAATPTAAAELVTPVRAEWQARLDDRAARLRRASRARLDTLAARLDRLASIELFRDPVAVVYRLEQRVDENAARLRAGVTQLRAEARERLQRVERRLWRVRPEAVLAARGRRMDDLAHRLRWALGHGSVAWERRVSEMASRLAAASPVHRIERLRERVDALDVRLARGVAARLHDARRDAGNLAVRLETASHERILARGFTITRNRRTGEIIRSVANLREGLRLTTRTADGEFDSRVVDRRQGELFE
jgi:exodeoxyribonuclease VII large subunit